MANKDGVFSVPFQPNSACFCCTLNSSWSCISLKDVCLPHVTCWVNFWGLFHKCPFQLANPWAFCFSRHLWILKGKMGSEMEVGLSLMGAWHFTKISCLPLAFYPRFWLIWGPFGTLFESILLSFESILSPFWSISVDFGRFLPIFADLGSIFVIFVNICQFAAVLGHCKTV